MGVFVQLRGNQAGELIQLRLMIEQQTLILIPPNQMRRHGRDDDKDNKKQYAKPANRPHPDLSTHPNP